MATHNRYDEDRNNECWEKEASDYVNRYLEQHPDDWREHYSYLKAMTHLMKGDSSHLLDLDLVEAVTGSRTVPADVVMTKILPMLKTRGSILNVSKMKGIQSKLAELEGIQSKLAELEEWLHKQQADITNLKTMNKETTEDVEKETREENGELPAGLGTLEAPAAAGAAAPASGAWGSYMAQQPWGAPGLGPNMAPPYWPWPGYTGIPGFTPERLRDSCLGTVKHTRSDRGFVFVKVQGVEKDIFLHENDCTGFRLEDLKLDDMLYIKFGVKMRENKPCLVATEATRQ